MAIGVNVICFKIYLDEDDSPLSKSLVSFLSDAFKTELKEINGRYVEYKTFVYVPTLQHLESLQMYIESYYENEGFKVKAHLKIRFSTENTIGVEYKQY